jgi:hypothetical protein
MCEGSQELRRRDRDEEVGDRFEQADTRGKTESGQPRAELGVYKQD